MASGEKIDFSKIEYMDYKYENSEMVKIPPGYVIAEEFVDDLQRIYNLEVRPDDIWLTGLLKTGTSWASELVWCVYHEADLTEAKSNYSLERWALVGTNAALKLGTKGMNEKEKEEYYSKMRNFYTCDVIERVKNSESPRFIRSHFPLSLLPPKLLDTCKIIYTSRNFKDTWISRFKQIEGSGFQTTKTVEKFAEDFLQDKGQLCPLTKHTREAWKKRSHKNMYFLFYEDMKKDLAGVIRKMADFLGKSLSDEQVEILVDHLSIDSMRKNKFANNDDFKEVGWLGKDQQFIRKGMVGEWKSYYSPNFLKRYDAWFEKHMGDSDFKFPED